MHLNMNTEVLNIHASFDDEKHQHQVLIILTVPDWQYQTIFPDS